MERVRHKQFNRFKFIPFSERISNINIDVFHRVPHRYEEESAEKTTFFNLAIQKWTVLNLTEKWKLFKKEIGNENETLPQLLNNKEKIVNVFLKNIRLQNELSLQPVLELMVALVKDLRHEIYPFYPKLLKELIHLLKFKNPDVLESTFTCLAYIFKYLSKELVKDLDLVLLDLATLLSENNPEYVRDFAAQSFSFVARKVKDKNKLLSLVLYVVQTSPHVSAGCGQLLFEMMKGVKGHSHSCAEELLSVMFHSLGKDDVPQKTLFLLATQVVVTYGDNISPEYSVLFKVLLDVLKIKLDNEDHKGLKKLLRVTKSGLSGKGVTHLTSTHFPVMVSILVKSLSFDEKIQKCVVEICCEMLNSKNLKLPQEYASRIITKVMQVPETLLLLQFISETSNCLGFEATILPRSLQNSAFKDSFDFLQILTNIVVDKTKQRTRTFDTADVYPLTLHTSTLHLNDFVMNFLQNYYCKDDDFVNVLCCLILVRHFEPMDRSSVVKLVINLVNRLLESLRIDEINKRNQLFVLCVALETLVYFKKEYLCCECIDSKLFLETIYNTLKSYKTILGLRSLDLYLTLSDDISFDDDILNGLFEITQNWLLSPQSNARTLALHILLKLSMFKSNKDGNLFTRILQTALDAELIPISISEYREKIKLLEKLNFEGLETLDEDNHKVVLKYLLGVLYTNFQLLWESLTAVIASYSVGMSTNTFWDVFYSQLRTATANCKGMASSEDFDLPLADEYLLNSVKFVKAEEKIDHFNYRVLMWNAMSLFPEVCESKNRDVISIYLPFIEDEILRTSVQHNLTMNIQKVDSSVLNESQEDLDKVNTAEDSKLKGSYLSIIKCAVAKLTLLSKFKHPQQCYREPDLRNSYLGLLLFKDVEVQKKALECVFTYKFSYMNPYKQNLRNLIDDVKFKDELVHFQIDTKTGVVKDIHRKELMPVILRILYSKMLFQTSTPRGNKGSANLLRRTMILRFLAGVSHDEMESFLKMAFKKWNEYCEDEAFQFEKIIKSVDLEKVPSVKKLQSAVNLVDVVLKNFGGLMPEHLQRYIFKVLLSIGSFVCGIFLQRDKIFSGFLSSLSSLRTSCLDSIIKFFDRFQNFLWKEDDINALFHVFVWPRLPRLPEDGIHGTPALLKLFLEWSKNPRYFKLLVRYNQNDMKMTPLPYILELLLNEKTQPSVSNCISSILENLLTLQEDEPMDVDDEENATPLNIEYILPLQDQKISELKFANELNYGSKILFPHVGLILTYLCRRLEKCEFSSYGKGQITVLSRVTEMATSAEHGDTLLGLLIKLLATRKHSDDDVLVNMMVTVENLTNIVSDPFMYLKSLAPLFNIIELPQARRVLVNLVANIGKRLPDMGARMSVIPELNAWDHKWMDQPDYETRLDAFKKIQKLIEDENANSDLALIVLYNCFFFIRYEGDISLRDSASFCLRDMCPKVAHNLKNKDLHKPWIESILQLVRNGIISTNDHIQSLAISLLGVMARECEDLHPVLKNLSVYADKSDPEVDFFENAQHLQIYRRMKALQRFSKLAKTLKKPPSTRTLVQFILPLASRYLACLKYSGKNTLIDSAIDAVATVCKFLPWSQYQTVLRFYLSKLRTKIEFQKQLTRTVIAILDSFHFDISQSPFVKVEEKAEKPEEKSDATTITEITPTKDSTATETERAEAEKLKEKKEEDGEVEKVDEDEKVGKAEEEKQKEGELVEELAEVLEKEENEEGEGQEGEPEVYAIDTIAVLDPSVALKVEKAISGPLLEELYGIISKKSQIEVTHKLNYKSIRNKDDEDVLKVPVAVTLVKLLQKLPQRMLDSQLPGIFMRLCVFLKSRLESVRRVTRDTIQQILFSLGPKYLPLLLSEMSASLTKGFQVHVMVYTMHAVIQHIQTLLQPGDIDANLPTLLEACKSDLFGSLCEEKSVVQIQAKYKEAKIGKSYHLIFLMAQYLTEKCLTDLIVPVKEVLQVSYSHKNLTKCREYLRQVTSGLSANRFISIESLFIYVYGTTSETIPQLMPTPIEPPKKKNPREKPDCFIIPPEPKTRTGVLSNPVKRGTNSNAHIIVEFGFHLLHTLLSKEKSKIIDIDVRCYLDPIGPTLVKALESQHVKVSTLALKCLIRFIKYNLPSIKAEVKKIIEVLFSILHKYAAAGLCKGNNFDLVMVTFKAISILIRDTEYHGITAEQLKILLLYTEQDIYDTTRQATAFTLLKTILKKKLNSPELHELMKKVAALSITSEYTHIRQQARQNVMHYMMDYPLKSKIEDFIGFFTSQLNFAVESGRQSSLEMIKSIVISFPQEKLEELCGVFLLTLGASLMNEESASIKKNISALIKLLLNKLDAGHKDELFEVVMAWFQEKKLAHKQLAAQVAGIFVSVETGFEKRLPSLLPVLQKQFIGGDSKPGQFVKLPKNDEKEDRMKDHHFFHVLQLLIKICSHYPDFLTSDKYQENVYFFTEVAQSLLCHPHEWVRFAAAQFLGYVFNSCEPDDVSSVLNGKKANTNLSFLEPETIHRRIKSLVLDHCAQFIPGVEIGQEFLDQTTKNLVYLARVLKGVKCDTMNGKADEEEKEEEEEDEDDKKPKLSLLWITKRMRRIINMELGQRPNSKVLRMAVLKWIGAVAMCLNGPDLKPVLYHLMAPVVRERELMDMTMSTVENPMKELVHEISKVLKKKVGHEEYSKEAVRITGKLMEKRAERKNKRAQEIILDPEKAAKRKIDRQLKKRELRKRKIEKLKGKKGNNNNRFKRRKKMTENV